MQSMYKRIQICIRNPTQSLFEFFPRQSRYLSINVNNRRDLIQQGEKRRHFPRMEFNKRECVKSETPKVCTRKSDLAEGCSYLRSHVPF